MLKELSRSGIESIPRMVDQGKFIRGYMKQNFVVTERHGLSLRDLVEKINLSFSTADVC